MTEYSNTDKGAIWKNDKKQKDTDPDFNGSLDVDGVEYWVNAWKRSPDANPKAPALKFLVRRKEAKPAAKESSNDAWDEESQPIPF